MSSQLSNKLGNIRKAILEIQIGSGNDVRSLEAIYSSLWELAHGLSTAQSVAVLHTARSAYVRLKLAHKKQSRLSRSILKWREKSGLDHLQLRQRYECMCLRAQRPLEHESILQVIRIIDKDRL
jgi:hypothetical protein